MKMYTMKEVCAEANMTYQTLRYYCNEGLVPNAKRDKNNHRIFDERDFFLHSKRQPVMDCLLRNHTIICLALR